MQRYILSWKFHNNSILLFVVKSETSLIMGTYKRVLLKLSGESLGGPAGKGIDENWLAAYAEEVAEAVKNGLQVAIVIGGGNIFRGLQGVGKGFERVDYGRKHSHLVSVHSVKTLAYALKTTEDVSSTDDDRYLKTVLHCFSDFLRISGKPVFVYTLSGRASKALAAQFQKNTSICTHNLIYFKNSSKQKYRIIMKLPRKNISLHVREHIQTEY